MARLESLDTNSRQAAFDDAAPLSTGELGGVIGGRGSALATSAMRLISAVLYESLIRLLVFGVMVGPSGGVIGWQSRLGRVEDCGLSR